MISLEHGPLSVTLLPELGASIASFQDRGFDIFRPTPPEAVAARDGRAFSCFPLIPYSNRIRHARFSFAGTAYALQHDEEDPRHALHGTARFHPWQVLEQTPDSAVCALDFTGPESEWPFPYRARQEFRLRADRLEVALSLQNTHTAPAPAGLGLHPYFPRHEGARLQFNASYVWDKDSENIPFRAIPDAGKFDFAAGRAIGRAELIDNAYGGWDQQASIVWPAARRRLSLQADPVFADAVVFTPVGRDYFALEPVTHRPDALNPNGDRHDAPMNVLPPGGVLRGRIAFILSTPT